MGIYDRDYARRDAPGAPGSYVEPGSAMRWLLGITVGVFIIQALTTQTNLPRSLHGESFTDFFILDTERVWHGEVWRLLTYGFLHSLYPDLMHIIGNMLVLWFAGKAIEERYGSKEFVAFYLTAMLLGGVAFQLTHWSWPGRCLGASGATTALLVLYALRWPHQTLLLFFVIPMPMWLGAIVFVALDAFVFVNRIDNGIAVQVHLAGALFAFLYYRYEWHLTGWLEAFRDWRAQRSKPRLRVYREEPEEPISRLAASLSEDEQLEAKMDAILEKVARVGMENLTPEERDVLQRASEVFRKRRE
jgi:membrane associated rhomboid family serine protease